MLLFIMRDAHLVWIGLVTGCGGTAIIDGVGQDTTTTTTTTTDDPSPTTTDTTMTTSTGSVGDFELTVPLAIGAANCQPIVAADPLSFDVEVSADNTGEAVLLIDSMATAQLTATNAAGEVLSTSFELQSSDGLFVPPGDIQTFSFTKIPNSATGNSGCEYCGEMNIQLEITLTAGGSRVVVDEVATSISCSF
ncbi:MAG: hypothetical protein AAGA56_14460 [Myxococcota bacterium]